MLGFGPDDAGMIGLPHQTMFIERGEDPDTLQVMTEHFRSWLEERLDDGRYYGFTLCDADQAVVTIGLMTIDWPPHPSYPTMDRRGYLLNVFVEPAYRRRGLVYPKCKSPKPSLLDKAPGVG